MYGKVVKKSCGTILCYRIGRSNTRCEQTKTIHTIKIISKANYSKQFLKDDIKKA